MDATRSTTFPWHNNKVSVFYPVYKFPWLTCRVAITHRASVVKIAFSSCYARGWTPFGRTISEEKTRAINIANFWRRLRDSLKKMAGNDVYFSRTICLPFEDRLSFEAFFKLVY